MWIKPCPIKGQTPQLPFCATSGLLPCHPGARVGSRGCMSADGCTPGLPALVRAHAYVPSWRNPGQAQGMCVYGNPSCPPAPGWGLDVSRAVQRTSGPVPPTHKESRVRGLRSGASVQGIPHIASTPHDGRLSSMPPARRAQHPGRDMPQRMPHRGAVPPVTPQARRPQAAASQLPVFIDESGWRRRTLQGVALVLGCACLGYLLFVGMLISGLRQPVGTHPPSTGGRAPSGPDSGEELHGRGAPARAEASRPPGSIHADRGDHDPPAGRSAPSAGGLEQ